MIIEYTGRQFVVTEKYKLQAEAGLERIAKVVGDPASAHVILTVDKYRRIAEITVKCCGPDIVAVCESAEMMTSLHDALAKAEQQAIRSRQRTTTIMRHPRGGPAQEIGESSLGGGAAANL